MGKLIREAIIPLRRPRGAYAWVALGAIASVLMSCLFIALMWAPDWGGTVAANPALPQVAADDAVGTPVDPRTVEASGPGALRGVAASHGPFGVIATWSDDTVYASFDDGRSFRQVLGTYGAVDGVAVDGAGAVFAVRNRNLLGVAHRPGEERWRELPYAAETFALAATGGWLAWLHDRPDDEDQRDHALHAVLSISTDAGTSWHDLVAPHVGNAGNQLRVEADGTIRLLTVDQDEADYETVRHFRGHVDGRPFEVVPWREHDVGGLGLSQDGWVYAAGCHDDASTLCAIGAGRETVIGRTGNLDLAVGSNQADARVPRTVAVTYRRLYVVRADDPITSDDIVSAPPEVRAAAVDDLGRALVISGDQLLRWSERLGWFRLGWFSRPEPS